MTDPEPGATTMTDKNILRLKLIQAAIEAIDLEDAKDAAHAINEGWSVRDRVAFLMGRNAGLDDRRDFEHEYDLWLDQLAREREEEAFADPEDRIHDAERSGIC